MAKPVEQDDWEDIEDWEDVPEPESKPSWMANTWATANKPLTDYLPDYLNPSKHVASRIAEESPASPEDWNIPFTGGMKWKGLRQGMEQGAADTLSGLSSPLNVATTAATLGSGALAKQGLTSGARGLGMVARGLSAPVAAHGGMQIIDPNTSWSEKGMGLTELAGGLAGVGQKLPAKGSLPKVGASLVEVAPEAIAKGEVFKTGTTEPVGNHASQEGAINAALETQDKPMGKPSTYTIKKPTKELVQKLKDAGYESAGISKEGYPIMRLKPEVVESMPAAMDESVTQPQTESGMMNDEGGIQSTTDAPLQETPVQGLDFETPNEPVPSEAMGPVSNSINKIDPDAKIQYNSTNDAVAIQSSKGATSENFGRGDVEQQLIHTPGIQKNFPASGVDPTGKWFILAKDKAAFNRLIDELPNELPESFQQFTEPLTPEQTSFRKQPKLTDTGMANEMNEGRRQVGTVADIRKSTPQPEIPKQISNISKQIETARMAPPEQKQSLIRQALDTNRTLLTAYDLSAPGRQGLPLIGRKEWWTSLDDMFKAWGSEKAFNVIQDSIKEHPSGYFKEVVSPEGKATPSYAQKVGLELTDLLGKNEEVFRSKLAEKIPGVRPSNRAFVGYLNKLRSDTFANMVDLAKKQGKDPETNLVLGKQIADFVNNATGRGKLTVDVPQMTIPGMKTPITKGRTLSLEQSAETLADVFFAPRLMASRVHTYTQVLNPKFYTTLDPMVRKEALKSLFALAGMGTLVGEAARLAGAQVNNDPTNSDFRKIKIGNTRIDPFGGFQQYPVAAIRLISGKSTSSVSGKETDLTGGRFGQTTRADVATRFFTNKLAPVPSFVWSWMTGKEFDGTKFDAKKALLSRTVPIVMQDLKELYNEDPSMLNWSGGDLSKMPLAIPSVLGAGMQTYGR